MNIQFKNPQGGLTPVLQERIEKKLLKLAPLADTKESPATAVFNLDKAVGSHQTGNMWEASITIDVNGTRFYTSELSDIPDKASEKVLKEIRIELKKARGKRRAIARREGGFWKRFQVRFGRSEV